MWDYFRNRLRMYSTYTEVKTQFGLLLERKMESGLESAVWKSPINLW